MPRAAVRLAVPALAVGLVTGAAGCAADGGAVNRAATAPGDAAACPGDVVDVVVSVAQWSDLVATVGGDCASVTTVLTSGSVDPHEFEPTTGDLAAFGGADLVVLNGAGYDGWAEDAVTAVDPAPAVVDVAAVAGLEPPAGSAAGEEHEAGQEHEAGEEHEAGQEQEAGQEHGARAAREAGADEHAGHQHGGADPHLWNDPVLVEETATAVAAALTELSPGATDSFAAGAQAWTTALEPYRAALDELTRAAAGRSYVATEPVFDRTARAVGLADATPEGFRDAVAGGGEPAPADLAAMQDALQRADVLVVNGQTAGALPEQVRTLAEEGDVPVVEVTESAPDGAGSFVAWQTDQLAALAAALGGTP
ncbi:zinc ABC transporter substrate-binding protein [Geodermatophilus sp. YIM 151500]|uniref:metal ABC transporter solute-binding protein, Zn/Mn family n=1 Tax=Geodermatophilus sp. YIM 151500 TaxID=2984531 RepID=UPI0021E3D560|nr:zinc ABC transporter substrate-binding protein [Geodermatophilus sp. YIM 151500]MCV2490202.1 zinc ABC transporter substrate-binding protein [Geodermatophilus sp. YIM 151500]